MAKRRVPGKTAVVLMAVTFVLAMQAPPASAATTCTSSDHCYTIVRLGPSIAPNGFRGDYAEIHARCLDINDLSAFVTAETWLGKFVGSQKYWVEAGIAIGAPISWYELYYYWADSRPGGGYHEHDDEWDTPSKSVFYAADIYPYGAPATSTSYNVSIGPLSGVSANWPTAYLFDHLDAGSETSTNGQSSYAISTRNMGLYYFVNGMLYFRNGWYYGSPQSTPYQPSYNWNTVNDITDASYYAYYNESTC